LVTLPTRTGWGESLPSAAVKIASGDIQAAIEVVPFDKLNEAYDRLRGGTVTGRLWLTRMRELLYVADCWLCPRKVDKWTTCFGGCD
jgi:hypothetical protein